MVRRVLLGIAAAAALAASAPVMSTQASAQSPVFQDDPRPVVVVHRYVRHGCCGCCCCSGIRCPGIIIKGDW